MPMAYSAPVSLGLRRRRACARSRALRISFKKRCSVSRRGIELGAAQQGVVARNQFAFERAIPIHLAEYDGLGRMVVQIRRVRLEGDGPIEISQSLVVFEVVEMLVSVFNKTAPGRQTCSQEDDEECNFQYSYYNFLKTVPK